MKIRKITKVHTEKPRKFYCIHVDGNEVVVRTNTGKIKGRNCGFGFLFGMSALTFASSTLRSVWTVSMCSEFIQEMKLGNLRIRLVGQYKNLSSNDIEYLTVATFFRNEFFKRYPVLEKWILKQGAIAVQQGFIRSPWGSRRLLPQLTYQGVHSNGREIKNLTNIAVNSPVQDYETVVMGKAMIQADAEFEKYGMNSYLVGTVHDSAVPYVSVEETLQALKIILVHFTDSYEQANGIPYSGECNVAEIEKGEVWGFGEKEVKLKDVEHVEIKNLAS